MNYVEIGNGNAVGVTIHVHVYGITWWCVEVKIECNFFNSIMNYVQMVNWYKSIW